MSTIFHGEIYQFTATVALDEVLEQSINTQAENAACCTLSFTHMIHIIQRISTCATHHSTSITPVLTFKQSRLKSNIIIINRMQLAQPRIASVSAVSNNRTKQAGIKLPCKCNNIYQMAKVDRPSDKVDNQLGESASNLFETGRTRHSKEKPCLISTKTIIPLRPVHPAASHISNQPPDPINKRLNQALGFILAIHATNRLRAHGRQDIVTSRQAHKERKRNQPDAYAKVGRNHRKGRDVHMLVVGRSGVGSLLVVGEESKPHIMVEKHQD